MPSTCFQVPVFDDSYLRSVVDWQKAVNESVLQAQRGQWEMIAVWQRAICAMQEELRDQWICRFGGGVPLDG